jgi:hypothetical protein
MKIVDCQRPGTPMLALKLPGSLCRVGAGVNLTTYVLMQWARNQARCTCGWSNKSRWFLVNAVLDADRHSLETGHRLAGVQHESVSH